jgi:hypothetical protein
MTVTSFVVRAWFSFGQQRHQLLGRWLLHIKAALTGVSIGIIEVTVPNGMHVSPGSIKNASAQISWTVVKVKTSY